MSHYAQARWRPILAAENYGWRRGRARKPSGQRLVFVGHSAVTELSRESLFPLFNNPARRGSTTGLITNIPDPLRPGFAVVEQYVADEDTAYGNGCNRPGYDRDLSRKLCSPTNIANDCARSWEAVGGALTQPGGYGQPFTVIMFNSAVHLMRDHRKRFLGGAPLQLGVNVAEHNWFATTACPSARWPWALLIAEANKDTDVLPPPKPAPPTFDQVLATWNLTDDARFGEYTKRKRNALDYLLNVCALQDSDAKWAWSIDNRARADFGLPYNDAWD
jgi:hypothetical protein